MTFKEKNALFFFKQFCWKALLLQLNVRFVIGWYHDPKKSKMRLRLLSASNMKYISNKSLGVARPATAFALFCKHVKNEGAAIKPRHRLKAKSLCNHPKYISLKWIGNRIKVFSSFLCVDRAIYVFSTTNQETMSCTALAEVQRDRLREGCVL